MTPSRRIALIGQRGVPATIGGMEHHVEEIGARLAARGHEVTVYCNTGYVRERPASYRGMRLRHLASIGTKHLDTIGHSAVATLDAMRAPPDVVHYHAVGPALVTPLPRYFSRSRVVLTVHGLDQERAKWGRGARAVLRLAGWMSANVPDATITVSRALEAHYREHYGRGTHFIPNGVREAHPRAPDEIRRRFGLKGGDYVLFVGRLVPEKAPDLLVRAFSRLPGKVRLVAAGSPAHTDAYARQLMELGARDPRVLFAGPVYGTALEELYSNAAAFVLPSHLEGLPLTLLEAASYGLPVVASDIPPHVEVLGRGGPGRRLFRRGDEDALLAALASTLDAGHRERAGAAQLHDEVVRSYSWDQAALATERVYEEVLGAGRRRRARSGGAAASGPAEDRRRAD
ncbi:MAG: glycosyltransferase family 4 protein [Candidatus Dormibacterales bacterium]